jgi:hypothetical protein
VRQPFAKWPARRTHSHLPRRTCPELPARRDDATFERALTGAIAYWTVASVNWSLGQALAENERWGISTVRQRHPLRLENFANLAERLGHLPALAQTARALADKLRALWPEDDTVMPLYPPFRDAPKADRPAPATSVDGRARRLGCVSCALPKRGRTTYNGTSRLTLFSPTNFSSTKEK